MNQALLVETKTPTRSSYSPSFKDGQYHLWWRLALKLLCQIYWRNNPRWFHNNMILGGGAAPLLRQIYWRYSLIWTENIEYGSLLSCGWHACFFLLNLNKLKHEYDEKYDLIYKLLVLCYALSVKWLVLFFLSNLNVLIIVKWLLIFFSIKYEQ